jgi:hypothetical protein
MLTMMTRPDLSSPLTRAETVGKGRRVSNRSCVAGIGPTTWREYAMRPKPAAALMGLLMTLALGMAGCAQKAGVGDGVATANRKSQPTPTATDALANLSEQERMIKFAQCMREHGVDMPDPEINDDGSMGVMIGGGEDGPVDKSKLDAANQACRAYAPNGGEHRPPDPAMQEKMRALAKCMRANGVPNFPDPSADGGIAIQQDSGIDPMDPQFQATQKKCQMEAGMPTDGPRRTQQ